MTKNRKGRHGWHQATPDTSERNSNSTGIDGLIKTAVVTLVVWRMLPLPVAEWLIRQGGQRDE